MTRHRFRKGSAYVLVIGTAMIVSLLTLATLSAQLIRHRQSLAIANAQQAAANAEAGIRFGVHQLDNAAAWRSSFSHGIWAANQATASGHFELKGLDRTDGVLDDDPLDPLTLVAKGKSGSTAHRITSTLLPARETLDAFEVGVCVGNQAIINSGEVQFRGRLTANGAIAATGSSVIWPDCEAGTTITGTGYQRTTTENAPQRTLPDTTAFVDHYADIAETIDFALLPSQTPNLVRDGGFESGISLWTKSWEAANTAVLQWTTADAHSGASSMSVSSRAVATDGPSYYLTHIAKLAASYDISCWVKLATAGEVRIGLNTRVDGVDSWTYSNFVAVGTGWTQLTQTMIAPTWTGSLDHAMLRIETNPADPEPLTDFFVDEVSVIETGTTKRLTHVVVGPDNNPFGTASTDGNYVLDCGNADLRIEHCRFMGTLVIRNPGTIVIGPGSVNWQPASPNLPSLIVDGSLQIVGTGRGLNEYVNSVNYNPTGVPFETVGSNTLEQEIYPSELGGIVWCTQDLIISGQTHFRNANLVVGNDMTVEGKFRLDATASPLLAPPPETYRYRYQILSAGNR